MQEALIVLLAWLVFGGSHLLLSSSGARATLTARYGPKAFIKLFALVTLITMSLLIVVVTRLGDQGVSTAQFLHQLGAAESLSIGPGQPPGKVLRWLAIFLASLGALLAIAGLVIYPKSPIARLSERAGADDKQTRRLTPGLNRVDAITRHPFFTGVSMLALAHLVLVPTLATAAFFVGLATVSLAGIPLQDRKLRERWPQDYAPYAAQTSAIPFLPTRATVSTSAGWRPWVWATAITAVLIGALHPVLAWGNGAGFAALVLLFGLLSVAAGLARNR